MSEEQQIKRGFNDGYLLAKHRPDLFEKLKKGFAGKGDNYVLGLIEGGKEHENEKLKSRARNYQVPPLAKKTKPLDKGKGRDMGDREG